MLKPKKKITITKKDMKEDKLVTSYFQATTWVEQNKKLVQSVGLGIVIVVVIAYAVINNMTTNSHLASTKLGAILSYYDQGKYELAINGEQNIEGLQSIVDNYGSTAAGGFAKFYLANSYFSIGNFDKALEYFEDANLKGDYLSASSIAGAAACYEAKGLHEKAADYFEKAAYKDNKDVLTPSNLFKAGQNFTLAGKKEKAIEVFKRIKKEYPTSEYAREVDRYIAQASL
ncbi:MAG: tetratricopeptide repeat protein [bacterium]